MEPDFSAREIAFIADQMNDVIDSESSPPTAQTEAERIREKAEHALIE